MTYMEAVDAVADKAVVVFFLAEENVAIEVAEE